MKISQDILNFRGGSTLESVHCALQQQIAYSSQSAPPVDMRTYDVLDVYVRRTERNKARASKSFPLYKILVVS